MRSLALFCVLVGAATSLPQQGQGLFSRQGPLYRDSTQVFQEEPSRYSPPAPQADQYVPEPPKYQKKHQEYEEDEDYEDVNTIPGEPGKDYPVLGFVPKTGFSCSEKLPGFYADEAAYCQVWHYCKTDGLMESFLCPNGTIYNQQNRVCEWWFNVKCDAETLSAQARVNEDLYIIPEKKPEDKYAREQPQQYSREPPQYTREQPQYAPEPTQYTQASNQYEQQYQYSPDQSVFRDQ